MDKILYDLGIYFKNKFFENLGLTTFHRRRRTMKKKK